MATSKAATIVLIAAMFALAWGQALATEPAASAFESSAAAPPVSDCYANLKDKYFSNCPSNVESAKNAGELDLGCCPELEGLLKSSPFELCCSFIVNKILSVCGLTTPPLSLCSAIVGLPVESPTGSEGSAPPAPPPAGNKAWNHGVSVSTLASLVALVIAFQFPIFPFFGI